MSVLRGIKGVFAFLYDFIVGDDWLVAVAVIIALAITYAVSQTSVSAWWVLPVAVLLILPIALKRATRPH
ncbi:MAG TPA: hypothetical protein VKV06_04020 [Acidimicrobiales bacterium]|nr:hypothetical protein [Acidimicrobiales bacterium]